MKKSVSIITGLAAIAFAVIGCGGAEGNDPGRAYMPDMYYSRAYEAYGYNTSDKSYKNLSKRGVSFSQLPVNGTMARGDAPAYPLPGTDSGYALSATYRMAYDTASLSTAHHKEAERLYQINCAICHGTALDGNGPLWKGGDGPYPASPRNLKDDYTKKLADGTIYFVITYGKGLMGSYASQVKPEERWWLVKYIREKQGGGGTAVAATDSTQIGGAPGGGASGKTSAATPATSGSTGTTSAAGTSGTMN